MIFIGELSLWVALLMSVWASIVSFAGAALTRSDLVQSGARGIYAAFAMLLLASAGSWTALFTHDFSIQYVAGFSSLNLPRVYTFAALWAGPAGELLLCAFILAACSSIAVFANRGRNQEIMPYVAGILSLILFLFVSVLCLGVNPFKRLDWIPLEGRGMNPLLQNPVSLVHSPSLYLGYAAAAIAFAFVVAGVIAGRFGMQWLGAIRTWTLVAWFFNTVGIVVGLWWAYNEPVWGTAWVLHPVRNASVVPWVVSTLLLHSLPSLAKRYEIEGVALQGWKRVAGYAAHGGFVLMLAAFAGMAFSRKVDTTLEPGSSREAVDPYGHRWQLVSQGISQYEQLNRDVTALALDLSRDGKRIGVITTEKRQYIDSRGAPTYEPSSEAGIRSTWRQDVYVFLKSIDEKQTAAIRIMFNPLVRFVWIGGVVLALGGLIAMWPSSRSDA